MGNVRTDRALVLSSRQSNRLPLLVAKTPTDSDKPLPFETALEEVEAIIRRIESGEVGLEDSIAQYERGVLLVKQCREVLDRVEQRVTDLTAQMQKEAAAPGGANEGRKST